MERLAAVISLRIHANHESHSNSLHVFRALAESIPSIVWTATHDGTVDWFNAHFLEFTGKYTDNYREAVHPGDTGRQAAWDAAVAAGVPYDRRTRIRSRDGLYHQVMTHAKLVRAGEQACFWVGATTPIALPALFAVA